MRGILAIPCISRTITAASLALALAVLAAGAVVQEPKKDLAARQADFEAKKDRLLAAWKYPGMRMGSSGFGSGGTLFRASFAMTTPDRVGKVVDWYSDLLGLPEPHGQISRGNGVQCDFVRDLSAGRPFELWVLNQSTKAHNVLIVVSRGEGEENTQVTWHYDEF